MAELTVQSERAFLKQPHIFQNPKTAGKTKAKRWYKDVGLGFKTPKEAIEGTYIGILLPTFVLTKDRQEMSFHRSNLHSWAHSLWYCRLC
jgi:Ribosomal_S17 N-terminal